MRYREITNRGWLDYIPKSRFQIMNGKVLAAVAAVVVIVAAVAVYFGMGGMGGGE